MSERDQMLGRLRVLEQEQFALTMTIKGQCKSIRSEINPALAEIDDMDIPLAAQQMRDMEMAFMRLQGMISKIARLRKELGLG